MKQTQTKKLYETRFESPLGKMLAIADEKYLYLLEFVERRNFEKILMNFKQKTNSTITQSKTPPLVSIEKELEQYFQSNFTFKTPIVFTGSDFQIKVWKALQSIPFGETRSYQDIAKTIGNPLAVRAVANANGANRLSILIPCHRVIRTGGSIGGYGGGIHRKEWLLNHERKG